EIVHRQRKTGRSISAEIQDVVQQVRGSSHGAWIYTDQPLTHILEQNELRHLERAVISPIELQSLERTHSSRLFTNILEAARFYFDALESRTILEQTKLPIMRDLRTVAKRLSDREKRLIREKDKYEQADAIQKTAQMLTSSGMRMDQRYETVTVPDYFAEKP